MVNYSWILRFFVFFGFALVLNAPHLHGCGNNSCHDKKAEFMEPQDVIENKGLPDLNDCVKKRAPSEASAFHLQTVGNKYEQFGDIKGKDKIVTHKVVIEPVLTVLQLDWTPLQNDLWLVVFDEMGKVVEQSKGKTNAGRVIQFTVKTKGKYKIVVWSRSESKSKYRLISTFGGIIDQHSSVLDRNRRATLGETAQRHQIRHSKRR